MCERCKECAKLECVWHEDEDGMWRRSCDGGHWVCYVGSPRENGMRYCPRCGAPMTERIFKALSGGEEK